MIYVISPLAVFHDSKKYL